MIYPIYVQEKAERFLKVGFREYIRDDPLNVISDELPPALITKLTLGCSQIIDHKGLTRKNPLECLGNIGLTKLLRMFHFDALQQEIILIEEDFILNKIICNHIFMGESHELSLFNKIRKPQCWNYFAHTFFNKKGLRIARFDGNRIYDLYGIYIGRIQKDRIYDGNDKLIGMINGTRFYDGAGNQIGRINRNKLYNGSGELVAKLKGKLLYDSSGNEIGWGSSLQKMQIMIIFFYFLNPG